MLPNFKYQFKYVLFLKLYVGQSIQWMLHIIKFYSPKNFGTCKNSNYNIEMQREFQRQHTCTSQKRCEYNLR